jgi:hypothetical protein
VNFKDTAATLEASAKPIGSGKFGAQLVMFENGIKAVLKTQQHSTALFRGVPKSEFHKREVAVYRLDRDLLKFDVVPETLLINWEGQEASLQKYVEGVMPRDLVPDVFDKKNESWKSKVVKLFGMVNQDDLLRMVVLDLIINNADRHARNIVIDTFNDRVFGIDHSVSFGSGYQLYKNIFHKYLFFTKLEIPEAVLEQVDGITPASLKNSIGALVSKEELDYTYWRARFVVDHSDRLAFVRVSQGNLNSKEFPSYESWFQKKMQPRIGALVTQVFNQG